jgi:hypothetical protein
MQRAGSATSSAAWSLYPNPGETVADAASGATASWGSHQTVGGFTGPIASSFTASQTTTVLTVTGTPTNPVLPGQTLYNAGAAVGTILSFGSGTGGAGTYNMSVSQSLGNGTYTSSFPGITGFIVTRASDLTTLAVPFGVNFKPKLSALSAFLAGTQGFYTLIYDQIGSNNITSPLDIAGTPLPVAYAPRIDLTRVVNGVPAIIFDASLRNYRVGLQTFLPASVAGSVVTLSGVSGIGTLVAAMPSLLPGQIVTGTNIVSGSASSWSISGSVLTITTGSGFAAGQTLRVAATANLPFGVKIASLGTGTGGAGTYNLNGTPAGVTASGTLLGDSTISAVNYSANTITLSNAPSATPGTMTVTNPPVWLDIPSGVTASWQNHSALMGMRHGSAQNSSKLAMLGNTASAPPLPSGAFQGLYAGYYGTQGAVRLLSGNSFSQQNGQGISAASNDEVIGWSQGVGGAPRTFTWQWAGQTGASASYNNPTASTLSGGSIGMTQQITAGSASFDFDIYDFTVYGVTALTAPQMQSVNAAFANALGIYPQIIRKIVGSGSSTTAGNGTYATTAVTHRLADALQGTYPALAMNLGQGAVIEWGVAAFPYWEGLAYAAGISDLMIYHPGLGNTIQISGSIAYSAVSGNTLTVAGSAGGASGANVWVPGVYVSGTYIQAGSYITAATATTITLSSPPTQTTASTLNAVGGTGAVAWANITAGVAQAKSAGYTVHLVGSASRKTFSTATQLAEFRNAKVYFKALCGSVADSCIDLEDDPAFGNGGYLISTGAVSTNQFTVASLPGLSTFTASQSGSTLTVTGTPTNPILPGQTIYNTGTASGIIQAFGTGAGGAGTYTVSQSQTLVSGTYTASFAGPGAYVYWPGMPYSLSADTGAQTITSVSGNGPFTVTLSGLNTGIIGGSNVEVFNGQYLSSTTSVGPWTAYPQFWNSDGQHFPDAGYTLQGLMERTVLLNANSLN